MRPLRKHLPSCLALCLAVAVIPALAVPGEAFAQASDADKATARVLGQEGQEALDKKDFKTAEDRFKRADSLFHAPTLALGLARSYAGEGRYVAAQETYNRIVREGVPPGAPEVFKRAVQDATNEVAQISPKIGGITITVAGPDTPKVTIDDAPVPQAALGIKRAVDPGSHLVRATAEGFKAAEMRVTVAEGGAATAALTLEKDLGAVAAAPGATGAGVAVGQTPTTPDSAHAAPDTASGRSGSSAKTIGFVALGVGAAGLAAGAVTGLMAMGKASDLKEACPSGACPSDQQDNVDSYKTLGLVSTIGFGVGIVGVGAGIYFLVTAPKAQPVAAALRDVRADRAARPTPALTVTPYLGFGSAGVSGSF